MNMEVLLLRHAGQTTFDEAFDGCGILLERRCGGEHAAPFCSGSFHYHARVEQDAGLDQKEQADQERRDQKRCFDGRLSFRARFGSVLRFASRIGEQERACWLCACILCAPHTHITSLVVPEQIRSIA